MQYHSSNSFLARAGRQTSKIHAEQADLRHQASKPRQKKNTDCHGVGLRLRR